MDRENLEDISGELFRELELEDQQYLVGEATNMSSCTVTQSPAGYDMTYDYMPDYS